MAEITLTKGKVTVVDDADLPFLETMTWCFCAPGYAMNSKLQYMHRVLMGLERGDLRHVDHINGDRLDNRRSNIRICSGRQNHQNRGPQKNNTSGYKGVSPYPRDKRKWTAQICIEGRQTYLGVFESKEDAARAYNVAANEHFGEFAWLNEVS